MVHSIKEVDFYGENLKIAIHREHNGTIIINYPGFGEDRDGNNGRYISIANHIQEKKLGTVIRIENIWSRRYLDYEGALLGKLEETLKFAISNSKELCGNKKPDIYLMGFSAGASANIVLSTKSSLIKKLLLIAPSIDAGKKRCFDSISKFKGELYIAVGENDEKINPELSKLLFDSANKAKKRSIVSIPNCGHYFEGENNENIFSQTPFWAFNNEQLDY